MNRNNLKINFKKIGIVTTVAIFMLAFGWVVTYGGWIKAPTPSTKNITQPLNTASGYQSKAGGLILNSAGGANVGLIIGDNNSRDLGRVVIGNKAPTKKLDVGDNNVTGHIKTTGILKPYSNEGKNDQVFAITSTGSDWQDRYSWMTLMGMPSVCSNPIYPGPCALIGAGDWKEYEVNCVTDPNPPNYSVTLRVCYKEKFK